MKRAETGLGSGWPGRVTLAALWLFACATILAHPEIDLQIARMDQEIAARPDVAELYLRRGELRRIHQDWQEAESDFAAARRIAPDLDVIDFHLGRLQFEAGRFADARKSLDRFLARQPSHVEGLVVRAQTLVELGKTDAAVADFTRAIEAVGPEDRPKPSYYIDRARVLERSKKLDAALSGLDEGLNRLGEPVTLQLYAIELELKRGRHDAALARLERIAARSDRQESWLVRRAEILEVAGRPGEARAAYASALDAIGTLPASRRSNRATQRLETSAREALSRLDASVPSAPKTHEPAPR